jgi:hypothetical protein
MLRTMWCLLVAVVVFLGGASAPALATERVDSTSNSEVKAARGEQKKKGKKKGKNKGKKGKKAKKNRNKAT